MQDEIREKALQELKNALSASVDELLLEAYPTNPQDLNKIPPLSSSSIVNAFFRHWYSGTTFIFRKNIKVTNAMLGEILALLQIHTTSKYEEANFTSTKLGSTQKPMEHTPRNFIKSSEMKTVFSSLWDSIAPTPLDLERQNQVLFSLKEVCDSIPEINSNEHEINDSWKEWYTKAYSIIDFLVEFYGDYFAETLLVDTYAGSCHVFSPSALKVDHKQICHEAGYIYSTGQIIYMRRSTKVDIPTLRKKLYQWLERNSSPYEVPIVVFSREQFNTSVNNDVRRMEINGIDDLKFHLDKFFFGPVPISELLTNIMLPSTYNKNKKDVTPTQLQTIQTRLQPWRDEHDSDRIPGKKIASDGSLQPDSKSSVLENSDRTIFIQVERHVLLGEPITPHSRYFLCFAQEYINRNQMFEIDEGKPGWTAPVTIPHTLAASMINIARGASYDKRKNLTVLDPFCGTGTFAFEASKIPEVEKVFAFDHYPLNKHAWEDNQALLTRSVDDRSNFILNIVRTLSDVQTHDDKTDKPRRILDVLKDFSSDVSRTSKLNSLIAGDTKELTELQPLEEDRNLSEKITFSWTLSYNEFLLALYKQHKKHESVSPEINNSAYKKIADYHFSELGLKLVEKSDWESRILIYLFWKSLVTNAFSIVALKARNSESTDSLSDRVDQRSEMLKNAMDEVQKFVWRSHRINFIDAAPSAGEGESVQYVQDVSHAVYREGLYSTKIAVNWRDAGRKISYEIAGIEELKNREELRRNIDIIATDPPYGFNVQKETDLRALPELYKDFMDVVLILLKDGGQVVFSVPELPMNGQEIPFYLTKNFITKQFLVSARRHNRAVVQGARSLPFPIEHFRPPFYWESERALRRAVMHFTVRDA